MRAGRAIRQAQALDQAAAALCPCGHPHGEHRQLRDIWNAETRRFERHPDHRPSTFRCASCDCEVST